MKIKTNQSLIKRKVVSVNLNTNLKQVKFNNVKLILHRYACIAKGNIVLQKKEGTRSNLIRYVQCTNGLAQLTPIYQRKDIVKIGNLNLPVLVKEIETREEIQGYETLTVYHYRNKNSHGRKVPLIIVCKDALFPLVLGYIELATCFIMSKPRIRILNSPFVHGCNNVAWSRWDKKTSKKYTNLTVRVSRCVVHPEFRGLGIAKILLRHAQIYTRDYWHLAGLKPLFLEITADMLRYLPFPERVGMCYIGETEGNLLRVRKDMQYLLRNYERVKNGEILGKNPKGILDLQANYAHRLRKLIEEHKMRLSEVLDCLIKDRYSLTDNEWSLFHRILRYPKPTYLCGLTEEADAFVKRRVTQLRITRKSTQEDLTKYITPLEHDIIFRNVTIDFVSSVKTSKRTRRIQEAFGISPAHLITHVVKDLSTTVEPKSILLIIGPSGSGKTALVDLISDFSTFKRQFFVKLTGQVSLPRNTQVGMLKPLDSSKPLIELFSNVPLETAIYALNSAGLAEVNLYLRHFNELSAGQQYRAMIASLLLKKANLWIADEFCCTLDDVTANIIAANLRKQAEMQGATVIVAAANYLHYIWSLKPDKILILTTNWKYTICQGSDFLQLLETSKLSKNRWGRDV